MDDTYAAQAFQWMAVNTPSHEAGWTSLEVTRALGVKSDGAMTNALRSMSAQPYGPFRPGTEPLTMTPGNGRSGYGRRFRIRGTTAVAPPTPTPSDVLHAFARTAGAKSARALAGTLQTTVDALQPTLDQLVNGGDLRVASPHYTNGFTDRRTYYSWQS